MPGYSILKNLGRFGFYHVLVAEDLALHKEVALHVWMPGIDPHRFLHEARITAKLPHPGIPAVHVFGSFVDGFPILGLKQISGSRLDEQVKYADRPRVLQAFLQACQAVGFAHSRGVIHRNIKPQNIQVGASGEVQVVGWGLAKDLTAQQAVSTKRPVEPQAHLGTDAVPDSSRSANTTDSARVETATSEPISGSPAYMPPEQAHGQFSDTRSDVFGLGATLCDLLTGKPPYFGSRMIDIIRLAANADLSEAYQRLNNCGADMELVALCRSCLSADPERRPGNGWAVADWLKAYLDGEQRQLRAAQHK
ncbi:MAG: serine/threonine protein kinase [Planctomycetes bacterium]|nr:serine/threonine protein kinase [Planctomycetota bacterium]